MKQQTTTVFVSVFPKHIAVTYLELGIRNLVYIPIPVPIGLVKTESDFIVGSVETGLGR